MDRRRNKPDRWSFLESTPKQSTFDCCYRSSNYQLCKLVAILQYLQYISTRCRALIGRRSGLRADVDLYTSLRGIWWSRLHKRDSEVQYPNYWSLCTQSAFLPDKSQAHESPIHHSNATLLHFFSNSCFFRQECVHIAQTLAHLSSSY